MAFKDLDSIQQMFGELASRDHEVVAVLELRYAQRKAYMQQFRQDPWNKRRHREYNRAWMAKRRQDPEYREKFNAYRRARRKERLALGLIPQDALDRHEATTKKWMAENKERMRELRREWKRKKRQDPAYREEVNRKERERRAKNLEASRGRERNVKRAATAKRRAA